MFNQRRIIITVRSLIKSADFEAVHLQLTHQTDNQLTAGKSMERRDEHSFKYKIIVKYLIKIYKNLQEKFQHNYSRQGTQLPG